MTFKRTLGPCRTVGEVFTMEHAFLPLLLILYYYYSSFTINILLNANIYLTALQVSATKWFIGREPWKQQLGDRSLCTGPAKPRRHLSPKLTSLVTLNSRCQRGCAASVVARSWRPGSKRPCTRPWLWRPAGCSDPAESRQNPCDHSLGTMALESWSQMWGGSTNNLFQQQIRKQYM